MKIARLILLQVVVVAALAGLGVAVCDAMHIALATVWMTYAGSIELLAAVVAMVPVILTFTKPADQVVQSALVATVLHMGVSAAGTLSVLRWMHPPQAFLRWLGAFYLVTLISVCRVVLKAIKRAPIPVAGQQK